MNIWFKIIQLFIDLYCFWQRCHWVAGTMTGNKGIYVYTVYSDGVESIKLVIRKIYFLLYFWHVYLLCGISLLISQSNPSGNVLKNLLSLLHFLGNQEKLENIIKEKSKSEQRPPQKKHCNSWSNHILIILICSVSALQLNFVIVVFLKLIQTRLNVA